MTDSYSYRRPGPVPSADGDRVRLCLGDAREVLAAMPPASVDCVVTSPPYWGLRDYRVNGQHGSEPTTEQYVDRLADVFDEVGRVLTPSGTAWLNLGDSFGGSWGNYVARGSVARTASARSAQAYGVHRPPQSRYRAKDLIGVPWRVAFALQDRGWLLRNAVVWAKTNGRPESVRDRLSQRYESVFLFARNGEHWFRGDGAVGVDSDVWTVAADRGRTGHRAAGTVEIAHRCVRLGCPDGGVVLDPFSGSGTTGLAALAQGCSFIGIDLDPECHALARRRLGSFLEEP
ncbi:site-specific DNA-methyltransferase [Amycolatopsis sp. WAC 04197]|uniref:DNA-methyltransferase n=1 Tax=Amycolatopsis sp. WAC 04197 TaxID=2203199 RepID=UPI000F7A136E|nr:site-specific DNA-methyltransferase [Amycolatopsis sp. WAC 04197]RSN44971.1 site-specific DNA-methyltransferase [Amycolatopsis sp. WAC 04197]